MLNATSSLSRREIAMSTSNRSAAYVPVVALGLSLSLFFVIFYVICIIGYLVFPGVPIKHEALSIFLPGFELLSWSTFFLGLVESFIWGWYIALIFTPLFNFFARRFG
jgi:2TM family of unknown function (DUF5676)